MNVHSVGMAQPSFKGWLRENGYEKKYINTNAIMSVEGSSSGYAKMKMIDGSTINSRLEVNQLVGKINQANGDGGLAEVPEYTFYA